MLVLGARPRLSEAKWSGACGCWTAADKMIRKQKPLPWLNHRKGFLFTVHCHCTGAIRTATP